MNQSAAITYFAKFIEKELGIIYSEFNYFQLQNRLEEIAKLQSFKDVDELLRKSQQGMTIALKQLILDIATNNETSFFRDPKLFLAIKAEILPKLFSSPTAAPVKIWSAACSSGQEPYTLSLMLQEFGESVGAPLDFSILATDISSRVLERAKRGRYSQLEVERGLSAPILDKAFEKDADEGWTIRGKYREKIKFQILNLLDSFDQLGTFDLIFCRNILIYQEVENKKRIINKLAACMNQNAYLVMGAGESMIGLSDDFETTKIGDAIIYRIRHVSHSPESK